MAEYGFDFLKRTDDIAKTLADAGDPSPMVAAGRVFFERLNEALDNQQSIVVETTMSGSYINKVAKRAKELGYKIKLIYIFIESPAACIERVKMRIAKGGHEVPEEDVKRPVPSAAFPISGTTLEKWLTSGGFTSMENLDFNVLPFLIQMEKQLKIRFYWLFSRNF